MSVEAGVTTKRGTDASTADEVAAVDTALGMDEWSGWLTFAGLVMIIAGSMRVFDAIWAFSSGTAPERLDHALLGDSLSTYAWLWLIIGIVLFVSGCAVMIRSQIARWIGVGASVVGAVSAIWWMPYYPAWSFVYVALGILVVYALVAHGQPGSTFGY